MPVQTLALRKLSAPLHSAKLSLVPHAHPTAGHAGRPAPGRGVPACQSKYISTHLYHTSRSCYFALNLLQDLHAALAALRQAEARGATPDQMSTARGVLLERMEQLCALLDAGYGKLDDMAAFVEDVRRVRAGEVRQGRAVYGSVSACSEGGCGGCVPGLLTTLGTLCCVT